MTTPPLPASPCVRVALKYTQSDGFLAGSRFFLSYTGTAPSGTDCTTLAGDIAAAWQTNFPSAIPTTWALTEVDVLDIASNSGLSGQWTGSHAGTRSGTPLPSQCASGVEFGLSRRYRGGKPRMYVPPGTTADQADAAHYSGAYVALFTAAVSQTMTAIEALTVGSLGTLQHVNLSYYSGFTNVTNTSGRTRAVPKYRATAVVDKVTGYFGKAEISSQKRRRLATTP